MIHTIIVDDEWYSLTGICNLAEKTGVLSVEGRFQNGDDALLDADRIHPQAALIDIEMPEMDGLTLAEKLLEKDPNLKIIFITGWNQYAVAAFEINALDYIMKPVNRARFEKMVQRLQNELSERTTESSGSLTIHCFGTFEVLQNGVPVIWQRTKAEELFAFLVMNANTYVDKDLILTNLWPYYERAKSLTVLQASVCKIRNILSNCTDLARLSYADSKYGLFLAPGVDCDYSTVKNAVGQFKADDRQTYQPIKDACILVQKGLMQQTRYSWSGDYEANLQHDLANCVQKMANAVPEEKDAALVLLSRLSHTGNT